MKMEDQCMRDYKYDTSRDSKLFLSTWGRKWHRMEDVKAMRYTMNEG